MAINFEKYAAEGNQFLRDYARSMGYPNNTDRAGRVLQSVLHAVRDQLTPQESVQLIAQLPMFLKAVYVNRWKLRETRPRLSHFRDVVLEVCRIDGDASQGDFPDDDEVEKAFAILFLELRKYVSTGELEDLRALLPKELRSILNKSLIL